MKDEATANVDNEVYRTVQGVIAEEFKDSTLLVIAHKIRTIITSDYIMVIDNGTCKEYGPPSIFITKKYHYLKK